MATLKAIRRRIASVKSTQQITRAMKLVAAARLRRAQEALLAARPYHEALHRVASSILSIEGAALAAAEDAPPEALMLVIASDRGLCGGYNANLIRKAEEEARRLRGDGLETHFFAVGRKAADHFKRVGVTLAAESINHVPRLATFALARKLATRMLSDFRSGQIREAGIVYSQFRSALSQRPVYARLLPVPVPAAEPDALPAPAATRYLIEPSRAELMPIVLRRYVEGSIFQALLESEASEHGARMTAMDNATNNASEMIENLTLEMNRARQATITKELMDIVGGAEALRA
ncbi:MAG TPA: ATP synthase F1 subunit gamma [Candidatus Binataceae bacterium]|nr:ATP synthase F1 subunit gamma [Candidatus Binataceae bacterium]